MFSFITASFKGLVVKASLLLLDHTTGLMEILSLPLALSAMKQKKQLERNKELEESYMSMSLEDTPKNQLLSSAIALMNIARLYTGCKGYDNAFCVLEKAMEIRKCYLDLESLYLAITYNEITFVYSKQGDYSKALEWLQKSYS